MSDLAKRAVGYGKIALQLAPPIGPFLASLIDEALQRDGDERIARLESYFVLRIRQLERRIIPDAVAKEEFAELYRRAAVISLWTGRQEKLKAAAAVAANSLLPENDPARLSTIELESFLTCVDRLSAGALALLVQVYDSHTRREIAASSRASIQRTFGHIHSVAGVGDHQVVMALVRELHGVGLLLQPGSPSVETEQFGNYTIRLLAIGSRFVEHLLEWSVESAPATARAGS